MPNPTELFLDNSELFPQDLLDKAIVFATYAHEGMTRKNGLTPYIYHPLEAMAIAASITDERDVLAAALLHDVIEDSGVSESDLTKVFNQRVAEIVSACSEDKREHLPGEDTWQDRKHETCLFLRDCDDLEILTVALADKLSNMRSLLRDYRSDGDKIWERFNQKDPDAQGWYYVRLVYALEQRMGETDAWKELREAVDEVFGMPVFLNTEQEGNSSPML